MRISWKQWFSWKLLADQPHLHMNHMSWFADHAQTRYSSLAQYHVDIHQGICIRIGNICWVWLCPGLVSAWLLSTRRYLITGILPHIDTLDCGRHAYRCVQELRGSAFPWCRRRTCIRFDMRGDSCRCSYGHCFFSSPWCGHVFRVKYLSHSPYVQEASSVRMERLNRP